MSDPGFETEETVAERARLQRAAEDAAERAGTAESGDAAPKGSRSGGAAKTGGKGKAKGAKGSAAKGASSGGGDRSGEPLGIGGRDEFDGLDESEDGAEGGTASGPGNADGPGGGANGPGRMDAGLTAGPPRLAVRKTYKLYVNGAFPRSESARSYPVTSANGEHLANASLASRKDARDAVVAARKAFGGWSGRTAYNRGQILYRAAEMMEGRRAQFVGEVVDAHGVSRAAAGRLVSVAIDRWVYYAGWTDKIAQVAGGANPVAGPYFNLSTPEPTGVVAVLAPPMGPLLGLVSVIAPVIATGNTAVVVASESAPLPAITLGEVLATSDLPGGVVNILTGRVAELAPHLASHADVNGLDLTGAGELAADLERSAADTLTRVRRPVPDEDWLADPGLSRMTPFLETKTVWHPIGV